MNAETYEISTFLLPELRAEPGKTRRMLVENYGFMIALGGADHGSPMIATRDVAEMLVGGAICEGDENLLIEAGGLSMDYVARNRRDHREENRKAEDPNHSAPAWIARLNQAIAKPFSASVANTFALMSFVADYQPRWTPERAIRTLNLPPLMTLSEYLDANYERKK